MKRPKNSYHPNIHYYNIGLNNENGKSYFASISTGHQELVPIRTLETLIQENGDIGKTITYLKIDIEGMEFMCFENWFKTGVFERVDQLGLEVHMHPFFLKDVNVKKWFHGLRNHLLKLSEYGFDFVEVEPNKCIGKSLDKNNTYYTHNDLLFVK